MMQATTMFWHHSLFRCAASGPVLETLFGLHFPEAETVLDATWGKGVFWRGWNAPPVVGTDLDPAKARDAIADATRLPFADDSFDVAVLDPPFRAASSNWALNEDYGTIETMKGVYRLYEQGIKECARVARLGMVVKCQDLVSSGVLRHLRWRVILWGNEACGSFPEDIAVFASGARIMCDNWATQQHLRRSESFFVLWKFGEGEKWIYSSSRFGTTETGGRTPPSSHE